MVLFQVVKTDVIRAGELKNRGFQKVTDRKTQIEYYPT